VKIRVIGGGLAGPEAALTAARFGCKVDLYEMRTIVDGQPRLTPAHQTTDFGELVCSNSLKSESLNTAPWLLKQEMRHAGSSLLRIADQTAVPAGHALAVDRVEFSRQISVAIEADPNIRVFREEVTTLNNSDYDLTILATGPLTSDALSRELQKLTGSDHLAFYDSISPIVDADSIDMDRVYMAARWDKGTADYINCPMDRDEYDRFLDALLAAEPAEEKEWEKLDYFESCLPIEILARRGRDTLRFGPMKPVGLRDPRTGKTPWAVVQLRKENLRADSYNIVGFQNHLKFGEQARVLRLIPGLGVGERALKLRVQRQNIVNPVGQTRAVREKEPERDRRIGEGRVAQPPAEQVRYVRVEVELMLLHQPHHADRGHQLGDGGDPNRIVGSHPSVGGNIGKPGYLD